MTLFFTLFFAGMLTILLPCILPLIPIVLGVSIAGRSKLRPLLTIAGMLVSFVGFTFLLQVVLTQFVEVADYMRIGTYYVLLLFGLGFLTHKKSIQLPVAALGGLFFEGKGWTSVIVAAVLGMIAMEIGGRVATYIQQVGSNVQQKTREGLGEDSPMTAFIMGLTMGLVWVPCAGPALGFAFTLVREEPGLRALLYLSAYGLGTAIPLLLIGYGGQAAVHSVRFLSRYSGRIKQVSGAILIITALAFQFHWFRALEIWFVTKTNFGNIGIELEEKLFGEDTGSSILEEMENSNQPNPTPNPAPSMNLPQLPRFTRAPELTGLGAWHNSEPFTLEQMLGKVVLVDFWTYSCINCIRTLPYIQGYWDKFKDKPFVLIGVHTPEFVFEKSETNVADAIERHNLTYPVAQDNDYSTWRAFANRYWPAKYLIDAEGYIRYTHFGEGAYDETDLAIQTLLAEIGEDVSGQAVTIADANRTANHNNRSPETYLGFRSWPALLNGPSLANDEVHTYGEPDEIPLHKYALVGDWQVVDEERQVLRSDTGEIRMHWQGGEINLVMGMEEGSDPATVEVEIDGETIKSFTIDKTDLFELYDDAYGEHQLVLKIDGKGAEGYAFTFGA